MQGVRTQEKFCLQALWGSSLLPPPPASRVTSYLSTAPQPRLSATPLNWLLKMNEFDKQVPPHLPTPQAAKLHYLLGPDPPPLPTAPWSVTSREGSWLPCHSHLLSFSQNPAQRHVGWAVVQRPLPTLCWLRIPRPGLQRPVLLPCAGGRVSTRACHQGLRVKPRGPPSHPGAPGSAGSRDTHPAAEDRQNRRKKPRQSGKAPCAQGCLTPAYFSWYSTVRANAGPSISAPPGGTTQSQAGDPGAPSRDWLGCLTLGLLEARDALFPGDRATA